MCREVFGTVERSGEHVVSHYGAITRIEAWPADKELAIEVRTDPSVPADVQSETIRRYNRFLEEVTGFSSKERAKRLRKSAQASDAGS